MSVLNLLLSRLSLSKGVGITTRENRKLLPIADLPAIPSRAGVGLPHLRKPTDIPFDAIGPLTETLYSDRTYHPDRRSWSHDGLYSLPLKPIKTINVTSGDTVPKALTITLSDDTTPAPTIGGALNEIARTWTTSNTVQKFFMMTDFWVAFDKRLDDITFSRSGKQVKLILYPTGSAATVYATIFGTHTLSSVTLTSYKLMALLAKTAVTAKKFALFLKSPGKFFEFPIEDSVLTSINTLVNNTTYFPWPWQNRPKAWGLSKGFKTIGGLLYTDENRTTRADNETYPTLSSINLFVAPRYFRFTANTDYTIPGTDMKLTGDAIFQRNASGWFFPGPTAISSNFDSPHHLFKCAAGPVWLITVSRTNGGGATDQYVVRLSYRYDRFKDSVGSVNTTLVTINATNYGNIWFSIPLASHRGAPSISSPSKRPVGTCVISAADGRVAYIIGYWDDQTFNADKPRLPTSIIRLDFTETGDADPVTGAGISCTATEIPVLTSWVHTPKPAEDSYFYPTTQTLTDNIVGNCSGTVMHETRVTQMTSSDSSKPGYYSNQDYAETTYYSAIWWIYPKNNQSAVYPDDNHDFEIIRIKGSIVTSGHYNNVDTYFWDHHEDHICTGGVMTTHYWDADVQTYTGDILQDDAYRTYLEGSISGIMSDATLLEHYSKVWTNHADPGTIVHTKTDQLSGSACSTHNVMWGASYAYPYNHLSSPSTDYTPANKVVRGYAVPVSASNALVCVNPRTNTVYVAPSSAASGVFF